MRHLLTLGILIGSAAFAAAEENAVFDLLTTEGVTLIGGTSLKLPRPTVADGANAEKERQMVKQAAGRHPLDRFLKNSRVAPFELKIASVKNKAGQRTGQNVDVWFVAYGTLAEIEEHQLLKDLGDTGPRNADANKGRELTADELAERGIDVPTENDMARERYSYSDGPLLERVQISGVMRTAETRGDRSILAALVLDERFQNDGEFPNQWRPLEVNELGQRVPGDPHPYSGCGGYMKATELTEPAGAMLVEIHVVFHEPQGWFDGANLLRSKLPTIVQENVRKFRGKLERLREN